MSMPTNTRNELLDDSMDDETTPHSSNPSSSKNIESNRKTIIIKASKSMLPHHCAAFGRAFMDMDLDDFNRIHALMHTSFGDLFPIASKADEPIVFIQDSSYEFSVKTKDIEWFVF
jgi:hypothetical protein